MLVQQRCAPNGAVTERLCEVITWWRNESCQRCSRTNGTDYLDSPTVKRVGGQADHAKSLAILTVLACIRTVSAIS